MEQVQRHVGEEEINRAITGGIVFKGAKLKSAPKAKKKTCITGQHGSGAAKMKAEIRARRANRHKNK